MRRRKCLLLLLAAIVACESPAPVRVGVVVSEHPAAAARIAMEGDSSIVLVVRPNPEPVDAGAAIGLAHQLTAQQGMLAVIGHSNSAASLAASQVYNEARVVQIAPTSTAPVYDAAGEFSFRMVPSDTAQARVIAATLDAFWPEAKRVAVVYVNDDYGRGLFRAARPALRNVVWEGIYADVADSTAVLDLTARIRGASPDVLLWLGRPRRLRQIFGQLRTELPQMAVLCSDACDESAVYDTPGDDYVGLYFIRFTDPTTPATAAFLEKYRRATGGMAGSEALLTHDATLLLRDAVANGARTGEDVRRYLNSLGRKRPAFNGITGPIQFDEHGSAARPYDIAHVREPHVVVSVKDAAR